MKKTALFISLLFGALVGSDGQYSIPADEELLAHIDTNTLKLRSKLYPFVSAGDLNIYGFNEDEIPVYSDSAYKYRLSLLECEIPLDYNEHVRGFIDLYSIRKRKLLSKVLTLSKLYFPVIEEIFDRERIPLELKYLAVIESALNHQATSPVGAAGMWQFMAPTGRIYGLISNNSLDERRDFFKSTEAAIKYLKNSYAIYKDWLLVIASYNCGAGNVNKAIRRSGGKTNFWQIMPYLPRETRGYVPAFVAAAYVMNYASEHNIYPAELDLNFYTDTVLVDNRFSITQLAYALNMSVEEIKLYNPTLRRGYIPFTTQKITLTLPYAKAMKFAELQHPGAIIQLNTELMALKASEPARPRVKEKPERIVYKVHRGDQLVSIAREYDVQVKDLKRWNKLKSNKIKKGQRLIIYPGRA